MENAKRYLECPECGTWTSRTEEFLARNEAFDCYQCGAPIAKAIRRMPIMSSESPPPAV
jgi:hypothetical protein